MSASAMKPFVEPSKGLCGLNIDPLRYDGQTNDPHEVAGILLAMLPSRGRVLDVGCGTGSITRLIKDIAGLEVLGVEPSHKRSTVARNRGIEVISEPFSLDLLSRIGRFDTVMFADVLEHLPDPQTVLEQAVEFLNPGGLVLSSIPNVAHWTVRLDLLFGRFDYQPCGIMDATHVRWFTRDGVFRLFEAAGYKIERYSVTAGSTLADYNTRWPWKWMRKSFQRRLIRLAVANLPRLFGCQHVVRAVRRDCLP